MFVFCTYFDIRYLSRGLALHASLVRHAGDFTLHVLCLDEETKRILDRMALPGLVTLSREQLERADPDLARARTTRSLVEYYFTCTSCLTRHVLDVSGAEVAAYVDADCWFLDSPGPLWDELGQGAALIIPHRFPPNLKRLEQFGLFNVGLLLFRNDARGRACLDWWRERCLEWCGDCWQDGRFADQKYLDDWPERFEGVVVSRHPGANVAPWNVDGHDIGRVAGEFRVDGRPLVFYHFHGLRIITPWLFNPDLPRYERMHIGEPLRALYVGYARELLRQARRAGAPVGGTARNEAGAAWGSALQELWLHRVLLVFDRFSAEVCLGRLWRPLRKRLWLPLRERLRGLVRGPEAKG